MRGKKSQKCVEHFAIWMTHQEIVDVQGKETHYADRKSNKMENFRGILRSNF
jgi:hypothetical protein